MEQRVIIAGSGGQGILFLGKVIAHAAMKENKEVTWFPSYGAEMRGGTANCMVVISDELIGSPVIKYADYLLVLNEISYNRFLNKVVSEGTIIYDSSIIKTFNTRKDIKVFPVEASKEAATIAEPKLASMVLLGAFIKISNIVSINKVIETIEEIIPVKRKKMIEINKKLILRGYSVIEN